MRRYLRESKCGAKINLQPGMVVRYSFAMTAVWTNALAVIAISRPIATPQTTMLVNSINIFLAGNIRIFTIKILLGVVTLVLF